MRKFELLKKVEFWTESVSRCEINSFNFLKEYVKPVDGNIKKFDEIYDEIIQHINEIQSS